jgi:hypothetical protein
MRTITIGLLLGAAIAVLAGCHEAKPVLPVKGVAFVDSLYGSTVVRISDKDADGYSGNGMQNEYARADAWNCDGTYLILRGNDGVHYVYDGVSYAPVRSLDTLGGGQELEPRWHATDPHLLYYLSGPSLKLLDVAADTQHVVHDFKQEFPLCGYVATGVEGDASQGRRYWCFMVSDTMFGLVAVCVYDMTLDSVVGTRTSFPDGLNHVTMDASGTHAVIAYESRPFQSCSRNFGTVIDFAAGAAGHADVAIAADGRDVLVYQNVSIDSFCMTDLETGVQTGLLEIPFGVNPDIGMHISGNCYAVPGWVLISTYGAKNAPSGSQHSWMDNLLFMLELKESPRILKLAQTRCYTGNAPRSNYFAEAFAAINTAGTKLVYGSNWGVLSPDDYTDAYEVRLPAGWNQ